MKDREITGWHVLAITVSAFTVIIAVNLTMAWQAVATFPGLEVKNSYVASQSFDADRAAQEALGWEVSADVAGDRLELSILSSDGAPVELTARELALLRYFLQHPGRVLSAEELLEHVWDTNADPFSAISMMPIPVEAGTAPPSSPMPPSSP